MELNAQLAALQAELKTYFTKAERERKDFGTTLEGTKTAITALQRQVDALDIAAAGRLTALDSGEDFVRGCEESESVSRLIRDKKGTGIISCSVKSFNDFSRKTTITDAAVGTAVSGVLQIGRLPGLTTEARQALTIRDVLTANPTTFQVIDFVKVLVPMAPASPVAEASQKPENAVTFTTVSERVKTIATWIPSHVEQPQASRWYLFPRGALSSFPGRRHGYEAGENSRGSGPGPSAQLNLLMRGVGFKSASRNSPLEAAGDCGGAVASESQRA